MTPTPFEEDEMELTDDDSYVMVNPEDFALAKTDSEEDFALAKTDSEEDFALAQTYSVEDFALANTDSKEESSAESKLQTEGTESSDLDNDEMVYMAEDNDTNAKSPIRVVHCQNEDGSVYELPVHFKFKADMEIKDVVKDHVLAFLPAKSIVKFRTVSKDWDRWIGHPFLAHKQSYLYRDICGFFCQRGTSIPPTFMTLNQSVYGIPSPSLKFLPESVVIRSSCNGLLLCQHAEENLYYICNPVNKEWKVLPEPKYYHGSEPAIVLVFEPSEINVAADFQLICAFHLPDLPVVYFEIFSSKEGSWRLSKAECFALEGSTLKNPGFYMKGCVYWATSCGKILAFDMKDELYGLMTLPPSRAQKGVITQIHGELCYIHAHKLTENSCEMNFYGGIDMSLKQGIVIDLEGVKSTDEEFQALPCVNDDLMMILIGTSVYSYHVRDQELKVISRYGNDPRACYLPYVNSLVRVLPDHSLSGMPNN